jgi:2-polyprenyl-3-methyl-5-hydroxy-6-metoxy-1,4-benzoquinol methylase
MDWDPVTHYQEVAIAERYDKERFSRLSGKVFNALEKSYMRRAFAPFPRSCSVVDVPCGTGRLAEVLLDMGFRVAGIDISRPMLTVAQRKLARFGDRFRSVVANVKEYAVQGHERFDLALCARVLMHFPLEEQIEFLKSVASITRGHVVVTQSFSTPYHRFRRRVKQLIGNPPSATYPISETELATLLRGAGLREVRRLRPSRILTEEIIVVAGTAPSNP